VRAGRRAVGVGWGLVAGFLVLLDPLAAQTVLESPAFSDPNLLAAIFMPPLKPNRALDEPVTLPDSGFKATRQEFRRDLRRPPIPKDWESFDNQYAPASYPSQPTLRLMEKGMYEVNQTLYGLKLFERKVNSLLSLEWTMRELGGYDPRSKANAPDDFFDHARVKTEFNWDAPIGLYVGVRFQIKCDSIFQFWK
jgi:hypothetical protein